MTIRSSQKLWPQHSIRRKSQKRQSSQSSRSRMMSRSKRTIEKTVITRSPRSKHGFSFASMHRKQRRIVSRVVQRLRLQMPDIFEPWLHDRNLLKWKKKAQTQQHETPPMNERSCLAPILLDATANIYNAGIPLSAWAHEDILCIFDKIDGLGDRLRKSPRQRQLRRGLNIIQCAQEPCCRRRHPPGIPGCKLAFMPAHMTLHRLRLDT